MNLQAEVKAVPSWHGRLDLDHFPLHVGINVDGKAHWDPTNAIEKQNLIVL
jgi:hypothetical protein